MTDESFDINDYNKVVAESMKRKEQNRALAQEIAELKAKVGQTTNLQIENALIKRGIQAEPHWLNYQEGQDLNEVIDTFASQYPHLVKANAEAAPVEPTQFNVPSPQAPQPQNVNIPGPPAQGSIPPAQELMAQLSAIEKDPVRRKALQELYFEATHKAQYTAPTPSGQS